MFCSKRPFLESEDLLDPLFMDRLFTEVGDVAVLRLYVNAEEYFATSLDKITLEELIGRGGRVTYLEPRILQSRA